MSLGDGKTTCRYCGSVVVVQVLATGVHYAKRVCSASACGRINGFEPKPDSDPTKYRRTKAHTDLVKKFSKGFCEMCLTPAGELPKGMALEGQHVVEYDNDGQPTRENIWIVCTACHRLIHWVRTYKGRNRDISDSVQNVVEAWSE